MEKNIRYAKKRIENFKKFDSKNMNYDAAWKKIYRTKDSILDYIVKHDIESAFDKVEKELLAICENHFANRSGYLMAKADSAGKRERTSRKEYWV